MDLKKHIRSIPDYPKKGILFRDITTLIKNSEAFKYTNDKIVEIAGKANVSTDDLIEAVQQGKIIPEITNTMAENIRALYAKSSSAWRSLRR